ncbi:LVIVD repeat-containing protein [Flagellimonas sp.]|uniref:LVIVD repeat-containing protein n=1 Tax=Flagellimonas sp. TaxID=2058762 RepID=UPI003F49FCE3
MNKKLLCIVCLASLFFISCSDSNEDDSEYADYLVARPLIMSKAEFTSSVDILPPQPINESGKVYVYQDYVFINDKSKGVHIIDNGNPQQPVKIAFLEIPGNVDISVKDNFLFADSIMDLIVLDISDINNIEQVNRLEGVLRDGVIFPFEADIVEFGSYDYATEILIGWETVTERRLIEEVQNRNDIFFGDIAVAEASDGGQTGQGGSLARFKIVDEYLYAVDSHMINVFDISDLENPKDLEDVYAGFDIETIFNRGEHLFLGSMRGMYIYDISSPATPTFVSEFRHGTACDPVVVDGDYAYVTLRGGNGCGALESGLFIVDISNIQTPELTISYPMEEPYGLGIRDEKLFVCDGSSGLKVYDKTNVEDLTLLNHFKDIVTFDVIPLESHLIMVGNEILYQYEYLDDKIRLISQIGLN